MTYSAEPFPTLAMDLHRALGQYHQLTSEPSPIGYLLLFKAARRSSTSARQASNEVLIATLRTLAAHFPRDADVLRLRFLDAQPVKIVANQLNLAEATVHKLQQQALQRLADVVRQSELDARAARIAAVAERLELPGDLPLVGIEAHLEALQPVAEASGAPWLVAIEGIGGIGKTALADALLRQAAANDPVLEVGWVSARPQIFQPAGDVRAVPAPALTAEALLQALAKQLLPDLPLPALAASEQLVTALRTHLHEKPGLIVIDNLETVVDVSALLPILRRLADPTRFVLTSRRSLFDERDIYHFLVPELDAAHALELVRLEARLRNLPELANRPDADLYPIVETVGGNPLALRLVVGQTHVHALPEVLHDLAGAHGQPIENLYTFIYRRAWDALDETSRRTLLVMPLVSARGGSLPYLAEVSGLARADLRDALDRLVQLNLVDSHGFSIGKTSDLNERYFSIHNLTRTFLHEQVARWDV